MKGRGTLLNPPNRFEKILLEPDGGEAPDSEQGTPTQFYRDQTESIINYNDSPDVGFSASINPYRGCEHGCVYCFARPFHEYFGFSIGLDFGTKILVKEKAPMLLRKELMKKSWKPQVIAMSGVTDCYQPIERRLRLTRGCLEVLAEFRNPVCIITKSQLVTRDLDLLRSLAAHNAALVHISVTSLLPSLAGKLEPRAALPAARVAAIRELAGAGVPVGVLVAPVIPVLNEPEIPAILEQTTVDSGRPLRVAITKANCWRIQQFHARGPAGLFRLFPSWEWRAVPLAWLCAWPMSGCCEKRACLNAPQLLAFPDSGCASVPDAD